MLSSEMNLWKQLETIIQQELKAEETCEICVWKEEAFLHWEQHSGSAEALKMWWMGFGTTEHFTPSKKVVH